MTPTIQKNYLPTLVIALSLIIIISACNLPGLASEPPLPTIVPASPTEVVLQQSTSDEIENQSPAEDQAENKRVEATPIATHTSEPTPMPTLVVPPTEVSPLSTATSAPPTSVSSTNVEVQLPALDALNLNLIPIASGFTKPVFLTDANDNTERLFVVEQAGRILILQNGTTNSIPFLDITSIVGSDASEQGLLSIAFHPNYLNTALFYVNYTDRQGDTVIARYHRSDNPNLADPTSAKILMTIGQPYSNHNGGQIAFGPDGYLYIGMGDGGAAGDPQNRAQNLDTVLGKILRIDVDNGDPYGAPENNPFVSSPQARPEIWSYGWRNPWRFSFDQTTSDMYVADVGQNQFEEVHVEPSGLSGQNYGWRLMEGAHCFNPGQCDPSTLTVILPVAEYDHNFGCSITGGYVYRGTQFPMLKGTYFYGDFCSGIIWGIRRQADSGWSKAQLLESDLSISSFGQDKSGEVYLIDHKSNIFQIGNTQEAQ